MLVKIGDCWVDPQEIALIRGDEPGPDYQPNAGSQLLIQLRHGAGIWITATMDEAEAALIDAGVIEEQTCDEPPELTEEEDAKAQALFDAGYKYLARDEDCMLYAYKFCPFLDHGRYLPGSPVETAVRIDRFFDFIAPGGFCPIAGLLLPY